MKLPLWMLRTKTVLSRIKVLEDEQAEMNRLRYGGTLDAAGVEELNGREHRLIVERMALVLERSRRGRKIAETLGFTKKTGKVNSKPLTGGDL